MIATDRDRDSLRFDLPVRRSTRTPSRRSLSVSRHCSLHRRTATATANSPPLDYKDSSHIATQSERAAEFPFSISGRPLWRGAAARQLRAARRRGSAAGAPARRRGEARHDAARRRGGAARRGGSAARRGAAAATGARWRRAVRRLVGAVVLWLVGAVARRRDGAVVRWRGGAVARRLGVAARRGTAARRRGAARRGAARHDTTRHDNDQRQAVGGGSGSGAAVGRRGSGERWRRLVACGTWGACGFYLFCLKKTGFCTIEARILGQDRLTYCAAFSNLGVGVSKVYHAVNVAFKRHQVMSKVEWDVYCEVIGELLLAFFHQHGSTQLTWWKELRNLSKTRCDNYAWELLQIIRRSLPESDTTKILVLQALFDDMLNKFDAPRHRLSH